ncbi:MAG: sterol desaturase family protein [Pseudomonadota bacterium]
MTEPAVADAKYQPAYVQTPPIFAWPPRLLASLKYLTLGMLYPWGFFYLLIAVPTWAYLTPSLQTMATFEPGWLALLWIRNCVFICLFAGALQWHFHIRKAQDAKYRINRKELSENNPLFLWGNQVRDNMFWTIASGVTVWTAYEAVTWWMYANGRVVLEYNLIWFVASIYILFFWSTFNFYCVHRVLHFPGVYKHVHELHHRNVDVGPWSGISMHPVEHLLYFTPFVLWWFVPVHPVIILITGFYQALNPALSHSGYDYLEVGPLKLKTGDWFHQLHHQYFNLNYGNTPTPIDKVFGSWHDGSRESMKIQQARIRERRRQSA